MHRLRASSNRCRWVSTSVTKGQTLVSIGLGQGGANTWGHVGERTHVQWFLLTPNQVFDTWVAVQGVTQLGEWEWMHLFDLENSSLLVTDGGTLLVQSGVDLTGAKDNTLNASLFVDGLTQLLVVDDPLEVGLTGKLRQLGFGQWVSQQRLGEEKNQRLSKLSVHLTTQQVEQVGRGGWVRNLHIAVLVLSVKLLWGWEHTLVFVTHLQVSLDSTGGVLWTLTVVTVRQGQDETGSLLPLGLTTGNELIDDDLSSVGEVTELSLPLHVGIRREQGITVFETHDTVLRQGRVRDGEGTLVLGQDQQWGVDLLGLLVVQDGVTLGEGTSLNILAGDSHVVAFQHQGAEGQGLTGGPVDALAGLHGLVSGVQNTLQVSVHLEALWRLGDILTDLLQDTFVDGSREVRQDLGGQLLRGLEVLPWGGQPLSGGWLVLLGLGEGLLQEVPHPLLVLVHVLLGEGAFLDQFAGVVAEHGGLVRDLLVHERLGERRLVGFVVAVLSVAHDVDDDIGVEGCSPFRGQVEHEGDGLNVVSIHVEDGGVDGLGNVGGVQGGSRGARVGGETDLVVDDDVHGTAGGVGGQGLEAHGLVDDTLGGESRVTVQQDRHGLVELANVVLVLLDGSGLAQDHAVLGLQVGGVGDEGQVDVLAGGGGSLVVHAQVVLDVTAALVELLGAGELGKDGLVGLTHHVGQHVQSASVGHADDHVLDAVLDGGVDQGLHAGHDGLGALEAETLVVGELGGQEGLEQAGPDQAVQDLSLLVGGVLERLGDLDALAQPVALALGGDVDVLHAVQRAVQALAGGDDLAQGHGVLAALHEARQDARPERDLLAQVRVAEAVVLQGQLARHRGAAAKQNAQRVGAGLLVAAHLVRAHEELHLQVGHHVFRVLLGARDETHRGAARRRGHQRGGRHKRGTGRGTRVEVLEVQLPRHVHQQRVLAPGVVHVLHVVGGVGLEKRVGGVGAGEGAARHAGRGHGSVGPGAGHMGSECAKHGSRQIMPAEGMGPSYKARIFGACDLSVALPVGPGHCVRGTAAGAGAVAAVGQRGRCCGLELAETGAGECRGARETGAGACTQTGELGLRCMQTPGRWVRLVVGGTGVETPVHPYIRGGALRRSEGCVSSAVSSAANSAVSSKVSSAANSKVSSAVSSRVSNTASSTACGILQIVGYWPCPPPDYVQYLTGSAPILGGMVSIDFHYLRIVL